MTKPFFEKMGAKQPKYIAVFKNMLGDVFEFVFANPFKKKIAVDASSVAVFEEMRHGGIFLTAHYGNHELLGYKLAELGLPLNAAAQEQKPAFFDKWLQKKRTFNGKCFAQKVNSSHLLELMDSGALFAMLADQRGRSDCKGEFLGAEVHCNPLPNFILEHRPNTSVFCGHIRQTTLFLKKIPSQNFYAHYHSWLESLILENPAKWYGWFHNRFEFCSCVSSGCCRQKTLE
ncbi:MAG: hypothetical protein FWC26_07260 [Fibromonadales bacterium]|nr:hypothetical protein [Fibromonadales bacterium]